MARREHFLEFHWSYLVALLCAVASLWISSGLMTVLVVSGLMATIVGLYYLVWRRMKNRSA